MSIKTKTPVSLWAALAVSLVGAVVLSLESWLALQGKSLCQTGGCEIVGHYIRFGETLLTAGGAVFFWLLALSFFFLVRYPRPLAWLPWLLLIPALAFDGALIGFQVFTIQRVCQLCFGIAALLIIITLLYSISLKSLRLVVICTGLLAWTGGFMANGIVMMPEPSGAYQNMAIVTKEAEADSSSPDKPATTLTLIFSTHCPACQELVSFLTDKPLPSVTWRFAAVDQNPEAIRRLSHFTALAASINNPHQALNASKLTENPELSGLSQQAIRKHNRKTISFLSNLGINTIPTLVIDKHAGHLEILTGKAKIVKAINAMRQPPDKPAPQ